jgi:hypothetical protein
MMIAASISSNSLDARVLGFWVPLTSQISYLTGPTV